MIFYNNISYVFFFLAVSAAHLSYSSEENPTKKNAFIPLSHPVPIKERSLYVRYNRPATPFDEAGVAIIQHESIRPSNPAIPIDDLLLDIDTKTPPSSNPSSLESIYRDEDIDAIYDNHKKLVIQAVSAVIETPFYQLHHPTPIRTDISCDEYQEQKLSMNLQLVTLTQITKNAKKHKKD